MEKSITVLFLGKVRVLFLLIKTHTDYNDIFYNSWTKKKTLKITLNI